MPIGKVKQLLRSVPSRCWVCRPFATVNQIYRWLVEDVLPLAEIVKPLNDQPIYTDLDRPWTYSTVRQVLTNEKYIGNNVYNRRSFKLKKKHVDNPPEMWILKEGAFDGIVPVATFMAAQEILAERSKKLTDAELLDHLKALYAECGRLSGLEFAHRSARARIAQTR